MIEQDSISELDWGCDPMSEEIDNQVSKMPDRPKVLLVLIKSGREFDELYENVFSDVPENYLRTFRFVFFGKPFRFTYLGFEKVDAAMPLIITKMNSEIWDEGVIYVDGKPIVLLKRPTIKKPISKKEYMADEP